MPQAHDDSTPERVCWKKIKTEYPERVLVSLVATPIKQWLGKRETGTRSG
jgi:hypothetical protein